MNYKNEYKNLLTVILDDLRVCISYTPNQDNDLLCLMKQYIKAENHARPNILSEIRNCMDGKDYKNPFIAYQYYGNSEIKALENILKVYIYDMHSGENKEKVLANTINSGDGNNKGTIHAEKIKAYIQFCMAMTAQAYNQKSASHTKTVSENEKYTFRVWLLRLGMIGEEFKTARKHLLDHLEGNIAWKDPSQAIAQKERLRKKREEQLTIRQPEGNSIEPQKEEKSLDRYEGYPAFYEKENMDITLDGKPINAFVYVMTEGHQLGMP